jgi:hypothetical protein
MHRAAIHFTCVCLALLASAPAFAEEGARPASEPLLAYVTVAGAPGDGEQALTSAMTRRLQAIGMELATAFQANVYEIQGTVRVKAASRGKQSVRVFWVVLDPNGKQLGIISQTKQVRKGSLDRKWGKAAEAAASAAINEIKALLPR